MKVVGTEWEITFSEGRRTTWCMDRAEAAELAHVLANLLGGTGDEFQISLPLRVDQRKRVPEPVGGVVDEKVVTP